MDDVDKTIDVGFCGSYANREQLLEHLKREHDLHLDIFVIGDAMVEAINSYKCHFNLNIANDINYRSFETIGCGTILLTNYNPQYEELGFEDGVNCLMYKDEDSLTEYITMVKYKDMTDIAKAGLEFAKKHTYDERVKSLLERFDIGS
jgi:spore maturation protein CgeB